MKSFYRLVFSRDEIQGEVKARSNGEDKEVPKIQQKKIKVAANLLIL